MRRFATKPALSAALVLAFLWAWLPAPAPAGEGEQPPLVFADEPSPPYTLGELGGTAREGTAVDLLGELFGRLGRTVEIRLMPWARVLKTVEFGQMDGIPLLMKNPEREKYLLYSDPVVENREVFFYSPERLPGFAWNDFADLKGYAIGLVNGYIYGEEFLAALGEYQFKAVYSQDNHACFRKLLAGRVDLTLQDESLALAILDEHPEWREVVAVAERPVTTYQWHMGVSRLSPLAERMAEINSVLSGMRADGSLARILEQR